MSWGLLIGLMSILLYFFKKNNIGRSVKSYFWPVLIGVLVVSVWLSYFRFSIWYLQPWPALASDFIQYCDAVLAAEIGQEPRFTQRSPVVAQVVALPAMGLGIIDGIIIGNIIAQVVLLCGLAAWSYLVGGRLATLLTFPIALSFAPISLMPRMLDFYPIYTACWTLNALLCAISIKQKTPIWAALGAGLSLLVDPRGLLWALFSMVVVAYTVLLKPRQFSSVFSIIPLIVSYFIAHTYIPEHAPSLELQAWWFAQERAGELSPQAVSWAHETFVWGHSRIVDIPNTVMSLAQISDVGMLDEHRHGLAQDRMVFVYPKLFLLLILILPSLVLHRYRPSREQCLLLILPSLPFLLVLLQTTTTQVAIRRLLISWPFAIVWLAYVLSRFWFAYRDRCWIPTLLLFIGLWGLTWSRFDPQWYTPMQEPPDVDALYAVHPSVDMPTDPSFRDEICEEALKHDIQEGHSWGGRFMMNWPLSRR